MKGLMARDMIAMDKNRVFLVVMLALCLFYTFSDMYVTGVMLMPMLFSTVCGNMVRNDLSAPIRRTLFTLPFSRREYAGGEVSRLDCPGLCARGRVRARRACRVARHGH